MLRYCSWIIMDQIASYWSDILCLRQISHYLIKGVNFRAEKFRVEEIFAIFAIFWPKKFISRDENFADAIHFSPNFFILTSILQLVLIFLNFAGWKFRGINFFANKFREKGQKPRKSRNIPARKFTPLR